MLQSSVKTLAPVSDWRIHLGAHKTATTHVQEILALMRPELVADGVDFIPNRDVRRSGLARTLNGSRIVSRLPVLRGRVVQRMMADHLDPLRQGPARLVLSEEKFIGGSQSVFHTPAYPAIERIVPMLASLRHQADVTFYLSIRSFDTQLPSAYAQELKFMPPIGGGFENLKARLLADPPSWSDLIARIRRAAPDVPLRVWRQEDYRAHSTTILSELCGCEITSLPDMTDPPWTRSPTADAIARAEALPDDLPKAERKATVREMFEGKGFEGPRYQPFTEAERGQLRAAYEADLARIGEMDPDLLMRF